MTDFEIKAIKAIDGIQMLPGSFDKRQRRFLAAKQDTDELTDWQKDFILKLAYKYRKQVPELYNECKSLPGCCEMDYHG